MAACPTCSRMRNDYTAGRLREEDLAPTWVEQFDRWFADVVAAELPEPNAVVVATADADGAPDARIVLVKGYDASGFVFGTSYASAKGAQLAVNPRAALVFPWHAAAAAGAGDRPRWSGSATPRPTGCGTRGRAAPSWPPWPRCSRPSSTPARSSRSGCGCSTSRRPAGPVPRPAVWGGYRVVPETVEFWQGGQDRLHDRLRFVRDDAEGGGWIVQRLAP